MTDSKQKQTNGGKAAFFLDLMNDYDNTVHAIIIKSGIITSQQQINKYNTQTVSGIQFQIPNHD